MWTPLENLHLGEPLATVECVNDATGSRSDHLQFKLKTEKLARAKEQLRQIDKTFQIQIQSLKLVRPNIISYVSYAQMPWLIFRTKQSAEPIQTAEPIRLWQWSASRAPSPWCCRTRDWIAPRPHENIACRHWRTLTATYNWIISLRSTYINYR